MHYKLLPSIFSFTSTSLMQILCFERCPATFYFVDESVLTRTTIEELILTVRLDKFGKFIRAMFRCGNARHRGIFVGERTLRRS